MKDLQQASSIIHKPTQINRKLTQSVKRFVSQKSSFIMLHPRACVSSFESIQHFLKNGASTTFQHIIYLIHLIYLSFYICCTCLSTVSCVKWKMYRSTWDSWICVAVFLRRRQSSSHCLQGQGMLLVSQRSVGLMTPNKHPCKLEL